MNQTNKKNDKKKFEREIYDVNEMRKANSEITIWNHGRVGGAIIRWRRPRSIHFDVIEVIRFAVERKQKWKR